MLDNLNSTTIIESLALLVAIAGLGVLIFQIGKLNSQIQMARQSFEDDHERSRRELAVSLLLTWSQGMKEETNRVRRFIQSLGLEQCRCISDGRPLVLTESAQRSLASAAVESLYGKGKNLNDVVDETDEKMELAPHAVNKMRFVIIVYLNHLESILSAWKYGVADRRIVRDQFEYLFDEPRGADALAAMRIALSRESFPSIDAFVVSLKEEREQKMHRQLEGLGL